MCHIVLFTHHAQNYEKYYGLIVLLTEFNEKVGYMKCWLNRYKRLRIHVQNPKRKYKI